MGTCFFLMVLLIITGCSSTIQNRSAQTSGFLNDYSKLREGTSDEAVRVYVNREVNFNMYDKVMIDPISIIYSKDSSMAKIPGGDRQKMADYFHAALENNLSERYIIASRPGSTTMRLRFALTDITGSQDLMNTVSDVHPIDSSMDLISQTTTGTSTYVGDACAEMEILDSMTGQRLAAAVDRRSGVWNSLKEACDYWSQRVAQRLRGLAGGY